MRISVFVLALLAACGDDTGKDGNGSDTDTTGDDTAADAASPYVVAVRMAECTTNGDGVDIWAVTVDVGDPQGDIESIGSTLTVLDGSDELAVYALACSADTCSGSWRNTDDGIDCSVGADSTFRIVIVDELGNTSDPFDYDPA